MSQRRGKAVAKRSEKAPAALKEGDGSTRSVTVRGWDFELPEKVPFGIMFPQREMARAIEEEDEIQITFALMDYAEVFVAKRILIQFVGEAKDPEDAYAALNELIKAINEEYGTDPGE